MARASGDYIKFLGTAGARFVMITQRRSSAGVLYSLGGFQLLVDPGPGCLVRCYASRPRVDPSKLDAILLTHGHLDHAGDVNVMLEAMTEGGHRHRGTLFAPGEALDGDPIVMRYVRHYVGRIEVLGEGRTWELTPGVTLTTPVRHLHSGEAYGLRLDTPRQRISHVADTSYFPELVQHYAPCDVLIVHMVLYQVDPERKRRILHMDLADATRLVGEVRPKLAILTHFGMTVLDAKPWLVAERMSEETGVRVLAARDGMTFDLDEWMSG
ncbi:MAG TPA: MBL fold metallo-hydrolase [Planctomycetota bacterium]|nr:MBL fold metallo-hydrolase [Planctomycetota bacterium]HRR79769.1 MBL fold metallo-hydrolase [Planctomycetota bacterium]HRT94633.1 MBL fold metallo-hydrolase [Planctomycetota bacterium]